MKPIANFDGLIKNLTAVNFFESSITSSIITEIEDRRSVEQTNPSD